MSAPMPEHDPDSETAPPGAELVPERRLSWAWIPPLIALLLVSWAGWTSWTMRGTPIAVAFQHGHGIKPGDALRYRGITVGEVRSVGLDDDLAGVVVEIVLDGSADAVAREGSRFWVVRPQIGLTGVEGIDTVVGARYLAVQPGDLGAARSRSFVGLEEPPVKDAVEAGSLQILLEARRRGSLRRGAPVTYRGIQIGDVLDVDLASDATSLEVGVYIPAEYATLIRANTRFWDAGGLDFDVGLSGLALEIDSLATLVAGGIAIATPDDPGPTVESGHRFALVERAEESWLEWRPPLPLGEAPQLAAEDLPRPVPIAVSWEEGRLLRSDETRTGWGIVLPEGLVAPADLLQAPEGARAGTAALRIGGEPVALPVATRAFDPEPRLLAMDAPAASDAWPRRRVRSLENAEDCLVVSGNGSPPVALAATRLARADRAWRVDDGVALPTSRHGASVVARSDSALVGVLWMGAEGTFVLPLR